MTDEITKEAERANGQSFVDTESMTLQELLDYRYSLSAEERGGVKANKAIAGDTKKLLAWSFHCAYQDRPILVILAGAVVLYHGIKFVIDLAKIWI